MLINKPFMQNKEPTKGFIVIIVMSLYMILALRGIKFQTYGPSINERHTTTPPRIVFPDI